MKKKRRCSMIPICMAVLLVLNVVLNAVVLTQFDNVAEQFFGQMPSSLSGDTMGADIDYYKSDFSNPSELYRYEEALCAGIAEEGIVLLKNDGLLPLAKGTELSLFSHSSVDLVSGGSGSGSGSFELTANLKEGLEGAGLKVNETLWSFYSSGKGSSYSRGAGVINYGQALDWAINECPLDVIAADSAVTASFGDSVAMFVLSRTGGEGGDEARDMAAYGGKSGQHYLEPDDTELEIIQYLNDTFDDVIVLVNCNNAMELDWVENYPNIKAVVNFPGAGRTGTNGLGYVLTGINAAGEEISPSGHLVDTLVYDNFSSPAAQNMGDFWFEGTDYYYVNYSEGIYVGYKYYETRYEDMVTGRENAGNYDYASTVLYPFGFGLSYTEFEWSNYSVSAPDVDGNITVTVDVMNVGPRAGKDVVQIYAQSPYTQYDIENGVEKAAVSLVGFGKTSNLAPGVSETVTVNVRLKDLISYDSKGTKTYILEDGIYYLTAGTDAHAAVNNVLVKRAETDISIDTSNFTGTGDASLVGTYVQTTFDAQTYSVYANVNGTGSITNLFDGATLSDAVYLSRSNWSVMDNNGLRYGEASDVDSGSEVGGKQWLHSISAELKAALDSQASLNLNEGIEIPNYTFGAKNDVDLIDLRGLAYDDPLWETLLNELTLKEMSKIIAESGYCSPGAESINKPKVTDLDGPAGLNLVVGHGSVDIGDGYKAMTWPSEYMIACTWNEELALEMGRGVGEDGLYSGVSGWYGPAMNIHRTPFAGRNFEYYSEDAFISGVMGHAAVQGAAQKGMYAFIKHFALNDQETHRGDLGLSTWASEQAIREIYLRPFEMTVVGNMVTIQYNEPIKNGTGAITGHVMKDTVVPAATAVMSSFNRIGATWAGGHYGLLTGVLRDEWGFNGFVLTDYESTSYMHTLQCLAAGGDGKLTTVDWGGFSLEDHPAYQGYGREAVHHILYTVVNSAGMNGFVHGVQYHNGFAYYKFIIIAWDAVMLIILVALAFVLVKKHKVHGAAPTKK